MPRKLCPKCHGQRTISCPACHGTGKKTIANTSVSDCEECGRTGRRPCDVCGGTGEVEHLSVALNGSYSSRLVICLKSQATERVRKRNF